MLWRFLLVQLILLSVYMRPLMFWLIVNSHIFRVYLLLDRFINHFHLFLPEPLSVLLFDLFKYLSFGFGFLSLYTGGLLFYRLMSIAGQYRLWFSFQKVFLLDSAYLLYVLFEVFAIWFDGSIVDHSNTNDFYYYWGQQSIITNSLKFRKNTI